MEIFTLTGDVNVIVYAEAVQTIRKGFKYHRELEGWIRGLGKGAFGMWAFKAHHGLLKPIVSFFFQKNGPHLFGSPEQVQRFSSNRGL